MKKEIPFHRYLYENCREGSRGGNAELCPSILSADFNRLGEQLRTLEEKGIRMLHIDVMDGMFVPSISFGMPVIRSIRKESGLFFDVHLMIMQPERYIQEIADCGADSITFHLEAAEDPAKVIRLIHEAGKKAAISIRPDTPVEELRPYLKDLDFVLLMTVEPGLGNQKYIDACTQKIRQLRRILQDEQLELDIQVDGGIHDETIGTAMDAGANLLVMGSGVFHGDLAENVEKYQSMIGRGIPDV